MHCGGGTDPEQAPAAHVLGPLASSGRATPSYPSLQGLGVSDDEAKSYRDFKRDYGDLSGGSRPSGSSSGRSSGRSSGSSGSGGSATGSSGDGSYAGAGGSTADYFSGSAGASGRAAGGGSGGGVGSGGQPPLQRQSTQEYVENELAALKRKLGKQ